MFDFADPRKVTTWLVTSLSTISLGARLYTRYWRFSKFYWDDFFVVLAWVLSVGPIECFTLSVFSFVLTDSNGGASHCRIQAQHSAAYQNLLQERVSESPNNTTLLLQRSVGHQDIFSHLLPTYRCLCHTGCEKILDCCLHTYYCSIYWRMATKSV